MTRSQTLSAFALSQNWEKFQKKMSFLGTIPWQKFTKKQRNSRKFFVGRTRSQTLGRVSVDGKLESLFKRYYFYVKNLYKKTEMKMQWLQFGLHDCCVWSLEQKSQFNPFLGGTLNAEIENMIRSCLLAAIILTALTGTYQTVRSTGSELTMSVNIFSRSLFLPSVRHLDVFTLSLTRTSNLFTPLKITFFPLIFRCPIEIKYPAEY